MVTRFGTKPARFRSKAILETKAANLLLTSLLPRLPPNRLHHSYTSVSIGIIYK